MRRLIRSTIFVISLVAVAVIAGGAAAQSVVNGSMVHTGGTNYVYFNGYLAPPWLKDNSGTNTMIYTTSPDIFDPVMTAFNMAWVPSADGGFFAHGSGWIDGDNQEGLYQTIAGLTIGSQYKISFEQSITDTNFTASGIPGQWQVRFGATTQYSPIMLAPAANTPYGWDDASLIFTATSTTQDLSFLARSADVSTPVYVGLDGVALQELGIPTAHITYQVLEVPFSQGVQLADQFDTISTRTRGIQLFGNPADVDSAGIAWPTEHQKWYALGDPSPQAYSIDLENVFGVQNIIATTASHLIVPAEKNTDGPPGTCSAPGASVGLPCVMHSDCDVSPGDGFCDELRHFLCYDVVFPVATSFGTSLVDDQFGSQTLDVLEPRKYCNPVEKTVECCNSDLDSDGDVDAVDATILTSCIGSGSPICDINCDGVSSAADSAILTCQFGTSPPDPTCCPGVVPEVYPAVDPLTTYTCYDVTPKTNFPISATTNDQFDSSTMNLRTNDLLCVSSNQLAVAVPEPGSAAGLAIGSALIGLFGRLRRRSKRI